MNKRELKNQQKGSLKHLKRSAHEVKSAPEEQSAPGVMTSSEASSSEAEDH